MKQNETDYLNKLFASSSDVSNEVEVTVPQVDVPESLSQNLHAIADSLPASAATVNTAVMANTVTESVTTEKRGVVFNFPTFAGLAASLFVAIMGFQFYQQQQTLKQLEQAQADLATALHYLGEANRIARTQVRDSLNDNIKKAGVDPVIETGRKALRPNFKHFEYETQTQNHSL